MGLLIHLLLIVMIVKSQAELQVASSGNQKTFSAVLDTSSKVDELKSVVENYLAMVSTELRNTKLQLEELRETVSSELEDTRRKVDELQVAVLTNTTNQLKDTRREMEELRVTVSGNPEMVNSEVRGIRRQLEELQDLVSGKVELLNVSKDCSEILARGVSTSGVYTVQPLDSGEAFQVYCDMETDGGGWTVFQRRQDGSVDFYLDFANYSRGFGDLEGEFWLGNDKLHRLTAQGEYELRVDLSDFEDESRYAVYDSFSIANVSDNYRLALGSYSGTSGDSMRLHNGYRFTTKDRDNDGITTKNCAEARHGAWWYRHCAYSNLNGAYLRGTTTRPPRGLYWYHWKGHYYSLKTSEMKVRAISQ